MLVRGVSAIVVCVLLGPFTPAQMFADQQPQAGAQQAPPLTAPDRKTNPYSQLFTDQQRTGDLQARAQEQLRNALQQHAYAGGQQPQVVCGMTVIPIDPGVDPKIVVPRPPSDTTFTMRLIPPPICRPE